MYLNHRLLYDKHHYSIQSLAGGVVNSDLLSELFGGAGRYRAFGYLFEDPGRDFGPRELALNAGIDPGNASRWLRRWERVGLVDKTVVMNRARYTASKDPSLKPLVTLFQERGQLASAFKDRIAELGKKVTAAAIFGSVAQGSATSASDIDLLLIGTISRLEAQAFFKPLGRKLGRTVNATVFTPQEWKAALAAENTFATTIHSGSTIALKGSLETA